MVIRKIGEVWSKTLPTELYLPQNFVLMVTNLFLSKSPYSLQTTNYKWPANPVPSLPHFLFEPYKPKHLVCDRGKNKPTKIT